MFGGTSLENEQVAREVASEFPQHKVILTKPFYIGQHEVTQQHYEAVTGSNPSYFAPTGANPPYVEKVKGLDTSRHPVEFVSWLDAAEFTATLSSREQLQPFYRRTNQAVIYLTNGNGYRLPTEAEWECACRAGTTTWYWTGRIDQQPESAAWVNTNCGGRTHAVGELKPNPFGLYDVHGNVWEFVQDWWHPTYYARFTDSAAIDPPGPTSGSGERVLRGGSWYNSTYFVRSSYRSSAAPAVQGPAAGFRVVLTVDAVRELSKGGTATLAPRPRKDLDRDVATWVLQMKGSTVEILDGQGTRIVAEPVELPQSPFFLRTITMRGASETIPTERLVQLGSLPQLLFLNSHGVRFGSDDVSALTRSTHLEGIALADAQLGGDAVRQLARMPQLKHIELMGWLIDDHDLRQLALCRSLVAVGVPESITDDGLTILRETLPALTGLRMQRNRRITPDGLRLMSRLEDLWIGPHHLTHEFAAAIRALPRLRMLTVSGQFKNEEFSALSDLSIELVGWRIPDCPDDFHLGDRQVETFLTLRHVQKLVFPQTPIEDRHVPLFVDAAAGQTISLDRTRLTEAGIEQIRRQLPQCTIRTDWRW
jgi:formylglycine-generating enzyme required for sulfatase activity